MPPSEPPAGSKKAQAVIELYGVEGKQIPKNGSLDALHCDHVFAVTAEDIQRLQTAEAWLTELPRFDEIVCVTAAENYKAGGARAGRTERLGEVRHGRSRARVTGPSWPRAAGRRRRLSWCYAA